MKCFIITICNNLCIVSYALLGIYSYYVLCQNWFTVDSMAKRDLYIKLNTTSDFLLKFWTENEYVGDRAILTWSSVQSVIKHFLSVSQSACPKNIISFDMLVQYHSNTFMIVKFNVLTELASKLNAFLVKFQTYSPMISFMSNVLATKIEETSIPYKLIKLDIYCQE